MMPNFTELEHVFGETDRPGELRSETVGLFGFKNEI